MQASIILQGRSVHRARRVLAYRGEALATEAGKGQNPHLSFAHSSCSRFCFLLPSSSSLQLAAAAGQPTYVEEMLRCKTVDCHGAVFSLCTAMVAVGVPGTTEGRRPRPPHRALPRLCLLYFGTRVCVRARTYTRPPPFAARPSIFVTWTWGRRSMPCRSRSEWR